MDDYQKRMTKKAPKILPCGSCGELLFMTYMPPGSRTRCRKCGTDNTVPEDNVLATTDKIPLVIDENMLRRISLIRAGLRLLAIGAVFYIGVFVVSFGPVSEQVTVPLSLIGRLGCVIGLLLLLIVNRSRLMIATAVLVALTQGYDAWSFHNRETLLDWLAPVVLFMIILVIGETARRLLIHARLEKPVRRALILQGLVVTTSFLFLLLLPVLNPVLQRLYRGNETLLAIAYTVGSLPFVVLSLVSAIMVIVVVVKVLRTPMTRILATQVKPPAA